MKRSRHTYHYSVRRVKKNKINIQKQRLADTLYDNTNFWKHVSYLNQASKSLPDVVDKASVCKQVLDVFLEKYTTIYTSVPLRIMIWHILLIKFPVELVILIVMLMSRPM